MKNSLKHLSLIMAAIYMTVALSSCSNEDDPAPSKPVKCEITCEVEYPSECYAGETAQIRLLSIDVKPESTPAPYVREVELRTDKGKEIDKRDWKGKPITYNITIPEVSGAYYHFGFVFVMSDNLQTYTSPNYMIKVIRIHSN